MIKYIILIAIFSISLTSCKKDKDAYVKISTSYGDIVVKLHNETPKHKENFLKLVDEHYFDSLLFHRVMEGFMIQGGDPNSRNAKPGQMLGNGGPDYRIDMEVTDSLFHRKGALAAAREPDNVNPEKQSSASQFYLVQGEVIDDDAMFEKWEQLRTKRPFTESQKQVYKTTGGTPFLDNQYTVFGQVVDGMEVIDKIAAVKVDRRNRPKEDVRMFITRLKKYKPRKKAGKL